MNLNTAIIEFNLESKSYHIELRNINDSYITFYFKFVSSRFPIQFNNLQFGILIQNEQKDIIYIKQWPNPGSKYISSDQEFLEMFSFQLEHSKTYNILLWTEESNIRTDSVIKMTIPYLEQFPEYEVE